MTSPFATCDWCDTHKNDSSGRFRVLPPVFRDFGALRSFCGPVVTVTCFADNSLVKAAVDSSGMLATPQGPVPAVRVVDGGASLRRAQIDELHHQAHAECFIANSVRTELRGEPAYTDGSGLLLRQWPPEPPNRPWRGRPGLPGGLGGGRRP